MKTNTAGRSIGSQRVVISTILIPPIDCLLNLKNTCFERKIQRVDFFLQIAGMKKQSRRNFFYVVFKPFPVFDCQIIIDSEMSSK